jgi:hypothetical protein
MLVVTIENCKEGMEVAKPVMNKLGLTLVEKDVRLTPQLIEVLKKRNVKVVYIKEEQKTKQEILFKARKSTIKNWILYLLSIFFIIIMGLKTLQTHTHLVPAGYNNEYLLTARVLFIFVILQQMIIIRFKKNQFGSSIFQQILSFLFSLNIITLTVIYFQNTALKVPNWKSFYFLILLEVFILFISFIAWVGVNHSVSKE